MAELEFVTIDLSKKQVDFDHVYHNEDSGKDYVRVFAPNGGSFLYNKDSLKESVDGNRVYFMRPVGTEISVRYAHRVEGVSDDAPNSEKYEYEKVDIKIEDLRQQYIESREQFKAQKQEEYQNQFMPLTVPESWARHFESKDGDKLVSISVPIKEENNLFYKFVLSEDHFKVNDHGEATFSLPIKTKDDPTKDYMVHLKRDERQEDGSWVTVKRDISTEDLAVAIKDGKERGEKLEIPISSKLVRHFESKDGTDMVSVSVPVFGDRSLGEKPYYYQIVLPAYRIKERDNGYGTMKTFLVLPDSDKFMLNLERSIKTDAVDEMNKPVYEKETLPVSARDVEFLFNESARRYNEEKEMNAEASIPDDISPVPEQTQEQNPVQHHRAR